MISFQVAPPAGYDAQNRTFPVTLPQNADPGTQLEVMLPALEPEDHANLPVATEVGKPAQQQQISNHNPWLVPPNIGNFEALVNQNGGQVSANECERGCRERWNFWKFCGFFFFRFFVFSVVVLSPDVRHLVQFFL